MENRKPENDEREEFAIYFPALPEEGAADRRLDHSHNIHSFEAMLEAMQQTGEMAPFPRPTMMVQKIC